MGWGGGMMEEGENEGEHWPRRGRSPFQGAGGTDGCMDVQMDKMVMHMCRDERASTPLGAMPKK